MLHTLFGTPFKANKRKKVRIQTSDIQGVNYLMDTCPTDSFKAKTDVNMAEFSQYFHKYPEEKTQIFIEPGITIELRWW